MTFSKTSATKNKHRLILTLFTISPSGTLSSVSGFMPFANFSIYIFALQVNSKSSKENSPFQTPQLYHYLPLYSSPTFYPHIPLRLLYKNLSIYIVKNKKSFVTSPNVPSVHDDEPKGL